MENDAVNNIRETGSYYTPEILADYLAERLITKDSSEIFDPSYGDGALLLAGERTMNRIKVQAFELFGCDIKPVNGLLQHLPAANLVKENFLDYPIENKFSDILMNPPYIRHRQADTDTIIYYSEEYPDFKLLPKSSDLWAFFLLKSLQHLKPGGSIGGIFPWAFLQADYAQPLRSLLAEKFENIEFISLSNRYFDDAQERVILIWLRNFGEKCSSIKFHAAKSLDSKIALSELPFNVWNSKRVVYNTKINVGGLIKKLKTNYGFGEFGTYADIKIGVVTGADDFFIIPKQKAKALRIHRSKLIPIINSSKSLTSLTIAAEDTNNRLISLKKADRKKFAKYIKTGVERNLHERAHSKNREPWYAVKVGKLPDAFFPYRISNNPFLVLSSKKIQSTNSVHRVYFKNLTDTQVKWLQVSLLSNFSQLTLELLAKTYGRGVLKLEPGSLKKGLVLVKNDKVINATYTKVKISLESGNKDQAITQATKFISDYLKLPPSYVKTIDKALKQCQELRHR